MRTRWRLSIEPRWVAGLLGALALGALALGVLDLAPRAALPPAPAAALELGLAPSLRPLGVGQALPELVLTDHEGRALSFVALRGQPVWLAFRGADCPYCREQLQELGARAQEIARAGVQLLAITPDPPATSARLRRELGLSFPFLSDRGEQAVSALCGGLAHCQLLIDPQGIVRWAGLSENWSESPAPEALLAAARRLRTE